MALLSNVVSGLTEPASDVCFSTLALEVALEVGQLLAEKQVDALLGMLLELEMRQMYSRAALVCHDYAIGEKLTTQHHMQLKGVCVLIPPQHNC